MQVRGEVVMPSDEEIGILLTLYLDDRKYRLVDAIRDMRALFTRTEDEAPTAETARIQGFADGLAKGIEHRAGRMSVRLEIAARSLAGARANPHESMVGYSSDHLAVLSLADADALIAAVESEKP